MATKSILSLFILLLSCSGLQAESFDMGKLHGLGSVSYHQLDSKELGRPLHIYVGLPLTYSESNAERYPVVYLLDGGIHFPMLLAYYRYLEIGEDVPPVIIVGISYGAYFVEGGNYRSTDFTAPSDERENWGGAPVFQKMFKEELFPLVEQNYHARTDRRILFGQSLGGQFVLYSALTKPGMFWGHIASNPALHRNLPFFLKQHSSDNSDSPGTRLFVSSGSEDNPVFREPAMKWIDHWSQQERAPWNLKTLSLPGQNHFSAVPLAFREGMVWLFSDKN